MKKVQKLVVLVSGGMDSVVALYNSAKEADIVLAISYDYGSKHNHKEIPYAAYHCDRLKIPHTVVKLDFIKDSFKSHLLKSGNDIPDGHYEDISMQKTVVPFRNGIMLSIATGYAESLGADGLVIAAHAGDHAIYPDCRLEFMKSMAEAIKLGTYSSVEVISPFIGMSKTDIALKGLQLGVDFSKTWSCYKGQEMHCGSCGTCNERREAFIKAGFDDPTDYLTTEPLPPKPFKPIR